MYISLWENSRGHPDNVSFMQFSTKIDGFEQKDSQGFENSYNSYEQYPLEKFFIFTIYQNYTLALIHSADVFPFIWSFGGAKMCFTRMIVRLSSEIQALCIIDANLSQEKFNFIHNMYVNFHFIFLQSTLKLDMHDQQICMNDVNIHVHCTSQFERHLFCFLKLCKRTIANKISSDIM